MCSTSEYEEGGFRSVWFSRPSVCLTGARVRLMLYQSGNDCVCEFLVCMCTRDHSSVAVYECVYVCLVPSTIIRSQAVPVLGV